MQGIIEQIEDFGATLVALTPQLPEHSQTMIDKHNLTFDLLSDSGNDYAARLGIRFQVPDDLKAIYQSFGINLEAHNGDDSWSLPIPGRFIIDATGSLVSVSVDPDYTARPEPETVLEVLERL